MYKTGFDQIRDLNGLYQKVIRNIDPVLVLEHYDAQNTYQKGDELIHSCIIDKVHPHHSHGDESPSASLNTDKMVWNCWSYGGGDIIWLLMEMEDLERPEALKFAVKFLTTNDENPRSLLEEVKAKFAKGEITPSIPSYSSVILRPWRMIHPYLTEDRGISEDVIVDYQIGFDEEENKITIPHFWNGKLVGYQKRKLNPPWGAYDVSVPKYKNSTDFPKETTLYNWDNVKKARLSEVVVVESTMSVLKCETFSLHNVLATFSGKVSKEQADYLKEFNTVILCMDNDAAGWSGTVKLYNYLHNFCKVKIVDMPKDIDLGDLMSRSQVISMIRSAEPGFLVIKKYQDNIRRFKDEKVRRVAAR